MEAVPSSDPSDQGRPVLGRPSAASATEPLLRPSGDGTRAAWRAEGASTDRYALRVASVVGVRHRLAGLPSDDGFAWAQDGGVLAVAVADGIGSVAGSGGAAERVCRAAVVAGLERGRGAAGREGFGAEGAEAGDQAVREAVERANLAAEGGGASTLVVAVLSPDGQVAVGRIGDSSAFLVDQAGQAVELFEPPEPDRLDTATEALPADRPCAEVRTFPLEPACVLVLATDGIADPWRDGPTTVAPAMADALRQEPGPVQLLALTDFSRQGCHDDRTILCVWRRDGTH